MSAPQQASAFNNQIPPRYTIKNITSAYTVTGADYGAILSCTGATSYTLGTAPASSIGAGFNVWIWNNTTTTAMVVTIDPNGAETIDGVATILLNQGEGTQIVSDGKNWQTSSKKTMRGYAENYVATATRPVAIANQAIALGNSYASGTDSFAAAIANNTSSYGAQGTNSVALGIQAKSTGSYSFATGQFSLASSQSSIAMGGGAKAQGVSSVSIGGSINNIAAANYSFAFGANSNTAVICKYAYSGYGISVSGDSQYGLHVLQIATTNATATVLTTTTGAAANNNQVILPNNSAFTFSILVVARQSAAGGTASASWKIEGLIRREGTAASTTLVASTVTTISNVPAWTIAVTADTTNGGLAITATGAAATNIQWVATAQTSEVTYA